MKQTEKKFQSSFPTNSTGFNHQNVLAHSNTIDASGSETEKHCRAMPYHSMPSLNLCIFPSFHSLSLSRSYSQRVCVWFFLLYNELYTFAVCSVVVYWRQRQKILCKILWTHLKTTKNAILIKLYLHVCAAYIVTRSIRMSFFLNASNCVCGLNSSSCLEAMSKIKMCVCVSFGCSENYLFAFLLLWALVVDYCMRWLRHSDLSCDFLLVCLV